MNWNSANLPAIPGVSSFGAASAVKLPSVELSHCTNASKVNAILTRSNFILKGPAMDVGFTLKNTGQGP